MPAWRDRVQADLGFPVPGINVRGNETAMPPRSALIMIEEVPELTLEVGPHDVFADATTEELAKLGIQGTTHEDPASGRARVRNRLVRADHHLGRGLPISSAAARRP